MNQLGLSDFIEQFLQVLQGENAAAVSVGKGSIAKALASADAVNAMYLQTQALQLSQDSRLQTARGDALDTFVGQFSPPFTTRIQAVAANQSPIDPFTLTAAATTTYLYVSSISGLVATQRLQLTAGVKSCTTDIVAIEPTTTLVSTATGGDTTLNVGSTAGMFVGASLLLTDGVYTATCTVVGVVDGTHVTVSALVSGLPHVYATATTTVTRRSVVSVTNYIFAGGAVIGDFIAGSAVLPITLILGARFFRNAPAASQPTIKAKSGVQQGYRAQTAQTAIAYEVIEDLLHPSYDAVNKVYRFASNAINLVVPVVAVVAGASSNIAAGTLTSLPTPLSGVDGVINDYPIINGADAETDAALRSRFQKFFSSQASLTKRSIAAAVAGVSTTLQYSILENVAQDGLTFQPGNFVIVAGDSTGILTPDMKAAIVAAVVLVAPITSTFEVIAPALIQPTIVVQFEIDASNTAYQLSDRITAVSNAIFNYFVGAPAGFGWNYDDMLRVMMEVPGLKSIPKFTINGNGFDRTSGAYVVVGTGPTGDVFVGPTQFTRPTPANITVT